MRPTDGVLRATNHFQHPWLAEEQVGWVVSSSESRVQRLGELLGEGPYRVEEARAALVDTCRIVGAESEWDCLQNPGTVYGTVAEPARLALSVRAHDRPDRAWVELDLADALRPSRATTAA